MQASELNAQARSAELFARARKVIPGGVNSPVRAMRSIGRDPLFIKQASGTTIVDVDGNEFIDWVCSWGPLIHGHAKPEILAAIDRASIAGTTYGAPTEAEVLIAEQIVDRVPSVQMVRMTSSGTEASMSAIRVARAATGREVILKFAGAYHGHVDGLLADAGSGLATQGIPSSPGVLPSAAAATVIIPFNDPAALAAAFEQHDVAALIAEPYPANMGLVLPQPGLLQQMRDLCDQHKSVLIFDEVISGFRVARGGVQEREGVLADLTVMGKVIGGGLPAAAFGGRSELMSLLAPEGQVYQAGTLSGNPLAVAAGLASLDLLTPAAYQQLELSTSRLAAGFSRELPLALAAAGREDVKAQIVTTCGLVTPFFGTDQPPQNYLQVQACNHQLYAAWCRELLAAGVYAPPSGYEAWFVSLAHSDQQIDNTVEIAAAALERAARSL